MQNILWQSGKSVLLAVIISVLGMTVAVAKGPGGGGEGPKPSIDTAGNNLSFPVIWAEGLAKTLPGTAGTVPSTDGVWWYQWGTNGTDPDVFPASCEPDNDEENEYLNPGNRRLCENGFDPQVSESLVIDCTEIDQDGKDSDGYLYCDDGVAGHLDEEKKTECNKGLDPDGEDPAVNPYGKFYCDDEKNGVDLSMVAGTPAADNSQPLVKAYIQKDPNNVWQAGSADWSADPVNVHWIDWGDNLESVDWYTRSQVRTEVVLFQDLAEAMIEYEMRHVDGWGIDEVHGLAVTLDELPAALEGPGTRATVYSPCARLTIQLLLTDRDDPLLTNLIWEPGEGWKEPLFDSAAQYSMNDVVRYDSAAWVAMDEIPYISQAPSNETYWDESSETECEEAPLFNENESYAENTCVQYPEGTY